MHVVSFASGGDAVSIIDSMLVSSFNPYPTRTRTKLILFCIYNILLMIRLKTCQSLSVAPTLDEQHARNFISTCGCPRFLQNIINQGNLKSMMQTLTVGYSELSVVSVHV